MISTGDLSNEVTITAYGVLMLGAIAIAVIARILYKHLNDCSAHRQRFHEADRSIEQRLTAVETNVEWLVRNQGGEPAKREGTSQ